MNAPSINDNVLDMNNLAVEHFSFLSAIIKTYFLSEHQHIDWRQQYNEIYKRFKEFVSETTSNENQFFPDTNARLLYLSQKFSFDKVFLNQLLILRGYSFKVLRNKALYINNSDLVKLLYNFTKLISEIYKINIPTDLSDFFEKRYELKKLSYSDYTLSEDINTLYIVKFVGDIKEKGSDTTTTLIFDCINIENLPIRLYLYNPHLYLKDFLKENSKIILKNAKINETTSPLKIYADNQTLITYEPDFTMDVTEIAECFDNKNVSPYVHFIKLLISDSAKYNMVLGNMVNYLFDELIHKPEIDFETSYNIATTNKPLSLFAIAKKDKMAIRNLKPTLSDTYVRLKDTVNELPKGNYSVEPTFISPIYGLQGRLDLLIEYTNEPSRKDVYELKSGNPPKADTAYIDENKVYRKTGLWLNHSAQTTAYNMLLESTFKERTGNSAIIYSKASEYNIRYAPSNNILKQQILTVRNKIVANYFLLANGKISFFDLIKETLCPKYIQSDLEEIKISYTKAPEIVKTYFNTFSCSIAKEIISSKLGKDEQFPGASSLWQLSLQEKIDAFIALDNLKLNHSKSNFETLYLVFDLTNDINTTVFRKGDYILLYTHNEEQEYKPTEQQIYKAVIKSIDSENITLSLRNKLINTELFLKNEFWLIEQDCGEHITKKHFASIFSIFKQKKEKQELLLGLREPQFDKDIELTSDLNCKNLTKSQLEAFKKAITTKDYLLIQGPPGTGKTSFLLKSLVEYFIKNKNQKVLVAAYTNRAVDEICTAIMQLDSTVSLVRLGSKESSEHRSILLSAMVEDTDMNTSYNKLKSANCVAATIATLLTNNEIFDIHQFDIAIIDEAAQILEPNLIGILSKADKFFLIGDEKQLPAIVLQNNSNTIINGNNSLSNQLNEIAYEKYSVSIFERLLKISSSKFENRATICLNEQARMHSEIQDYPNKYFYNGKLNILNKDKQTATNNLYINPNDSNLTKIMSLHRLLFVNIKSGWFSKINNEHTILIRNLINIIKDAYKEKFQENTLGIISPFRAQCADIYKTLDNEEKKLITVDTVERFQGSERENIIISYPLNSALLFELINSKTIIEGVQICRKLNVSLTRAKERIIFIADAKILEKDEVYKNFIDYLKVNEAFVENL